MVSTVSGRHRYLLIRHFCTTPSILTDSRASAHNRELVLDKLIYQEIELRRILIFESEIKRNDLTYNFFRSDTIHQPAFFDHPIVELRF